MSDHAKLSPSSASRWLACTPSASLEAGFTDTAGQAAQEGTLAHLLCETMLRQHLNPIDKKAYEKSIEVIKKDPLYDNSMLQHCEDYVGAVLASTSELSAVFIETRLDMTSYVPEGFGTADAIIITGHLLDFWDLKYGKGVPVGAFNNKQLMLYALGALNDFGQLYDIEVIRVNIFQPRINNHSSWEFSAKELIDWAETELKEKALMAFNGEGVQVAGDHCRFCKVKPKCRALADLNNQVAANVFKDPNLLSDAEFVDVLDKVELISKYLSAVSEYAFDQALAGKHWPGYKLVEGRSNRIISDPAGLTTKLVEQGHTNIYTKPALLGITALEKALGSKPFKELVEPNLIKPQGKPTLVPESDKRPAFNTPESVFTTIEN